jgi:hypothetical protein
MDERNIVHSLVYDRLRIDAFAKFHRSLEKMLFHCIKKTDVIRLFEI